VQCATFSKSLNPQNIEKSVSDILIRIRFPLKAVFGYPYPIAYFLSCWIPNRQLDKRRIARCFTGNMGNVCPVYGKFSEILFEKWQC